MNKLRQYHLVRLGPSQIWGVESFRAAPRLFQSLGEGANKDTYWSGQVALEGGNLSWLETGHASEAAWLADITSKTWLPLELAGVQIQFNGAADNLAFLVTTFPRFIRLRELGTLTAGHFIDLSIAQAEG